MKHTIIIDVESDGQVPGINSMVCFGAVVVDKDGKFNQTFYGQTAPISKIYDPEALAISGFTRKEHEKFQTPDKTMDEFNEWLKKLGNSSKILYSDNNQFDGMYMNYYCHVYLGSNPFGWSSRRIGDLFCGFFNDPYYKWKKHRKTSHTHNPVDDAKGNAEALYWLYTQGYKLF
jgi:hypothetical protein